MQKEAEFTFTSKELCRAAHGNLVSIILVANLYFQAQELDVAAFWRFMGQKFLAGWTEVEKGDLDEVARRITYNISSCGAELQSYSRDESQGKLVFTGWPPPAMADFFAISAVEAAPVCEVFQPIAASLGLNYTWQLSEDIITIWLEKTA